MDRGMMEFYRNALQGVITNSPLCAEYKGEWRACGDDKEKMVKLVLRQQSLPFFMTYCNQGKGLTKEYILRTFPEFINGRREILDADLVNGYTYRIHVANEGEITAVSDVNAFMWCDCVTVNVEAGRCPLFYIGCNSEVHLILNGCDSPKVYLFDNSKLVIDDADETCSLMVYKYSDDAIVETGKYCLIEKLKVFRKELRL